MQLCRSSGRHGKDEMIKSTKKFQGFNETKYRHDFTTDKNDKEAVVFEGFDKSLIILASERHSEETAKLYEGNNWSDANIVIERYLEGS